MRYAAEKFSRVCGGVSYWGTGRDEGLHGVLRRGENVLEAGEVKTVLHGFLRDLLQPILDFNKSTADLARFRFELANPTPGHGHDGSVALVVGGAARG